MYLGVDEHKVWDAADSVFSRLLSPLAVLNVQHHQIHTAHTVAHVQGAGILNTMHNCSSITAGKHMY